jgi:uncharacterized protein DUF6502
VVAGPITPFTWITDSVPKELESHLIRATRRILRPLVRILLRNGITAIAFQEVARKVFVDVAHDEFGIDGKPQTLARVSVVTGLNRKEVARLYKLEDLADDDRIWWNRAGTVLAGWMSDEAFQSKAGYPLDLAFAGESPNFTDLVKKYSGDMYPRSVADELLRLGAIEEVNGGYRMTHRGYAPDADATAMVDILGMDAAEFIETIDHNIQVAADDKLMQVKVLANNLPAKHLNAFNKHSKRVSMSALEEIVHWLNQHDAGKDQTGSDARYAVGIGMFQINKLVRAERTPKDGEEL